MHFCETFKIVPDFAASIIKLWTSKSLTCKTHACHRTVFLNLAAPFLCLCGTPGYNLIANRHQVPKFSAPFFSVFRTLKRSASPWLRTTAAEYEAIFSKVLNKSLFEKIQSFFCPNSLFKWKTFLCEFVGSSVSICHFT